MKTIGIIATFILFAVSEQSHALETPDSAKPTSDDSYLWLEELESKQSLEWVKKQNNATLSELENTDTYKQSFKSNLDMIESNDRLVFIEERDGFIYNLLQSEEHKLGLYRRTKYEEYKKEQPQWETVFDLDKISEADGVEWHFRGVNCLYSNLNRCLMSLSPGGTDKAVVREFDIQKRGFVEDGFELSASRTFLSWKDENSVFVTTDFGEGTMTNSGYPRINKLWKRGQKLEDAVTIFETSKEFLGTSIDRYQDEYGSLEVVYEAKSFYESNYYLLEGTTPIPLRIPEDSTITTYRSGQILISLKSDWQVSGELFRQGSIVSVPADQITSADPKVTLLIEPTEQLFIDDVYTSKSTILVSVLDNVKSKIIRFERKGGKWVSKPLNTDDTGTVRIASISEDSDDFYINYSSYLSPTSLYKFDSRTETLDFVKSEKKLFDITGLETKQYWTESKDGTRIPYFITKRQSIELNGKNPTLMYGYGGFELSVLPFYSSIVGRNWLEKGGVYVVANIRGGGEFGPNWHKAALTTNRHKAFEDFEAVAEDLIKRKITSPAHLGIQGQSNGGLLVAATLMRRPDLYNAVVSRSPMMDMKRYAKLHGGAGWIAEFGDPEQPEMWDYLQTYSPFHNIKPGVKYPRMLVTSSMNDDRVHPAHARKMIAKLQSVGNKPYYFESLEGGHVDATDSTNLAAMYALIYSYLWQQLQ